MTAVGALDLRIPSDLREIEPVVAEVVRSCLAHAFAHAFAQRQLAFNLPVALTEALSNAILRGNREDAEKWVRVRVQFADREVIVEVEDQGEGFDLEACTTDPTTPENLYREDGRGLFLMRALMDRVERFHGEGNVVRLTLRSAEHAA